MARPFNRNLKRFQPKLFRNKGGPPSFSDLNTFHKIITGNIFAESINNLPAKFLPRIGDLNGTDDILTFTQISGKELEIYIDLLDYTRAANDAIFGRTDAAVDFVTFTNDTSLAIRIISNDLNFTVPDISLLSNIKLKIVIRTALSVTYCRVFINDVESVTGELNTGGDDSITLNNIGTLFTLAYITSKVKEAYIKNTSTGVYHFHTFPTGQGNFEYDIESQENHLTWSGTGPRFDYDINGSTYSNDNGYSQWRHSTYPILPDIQVPFDINGNPLSLTAGVDIPTGYSHYKDHAAGGNKWNMADSLEGYNETESANAVLEIFDRLNATRQTAASRASIYYDNTNLATRSTYHTTEASDPRIYDTFFEAAWKDKFFAKVLLDGSNIIRKDEQLVYVTQKAGANLTSVTNYCKITEIYP